MKKSKKILPLILLPLILTGCGERGGDDSSVASTGAPSTQDSGSVPAGNSDSVAPESDSHQNSVTPESTSSSAAKKPILRQAQIDALNGEDYTADISFSISSSGTAVLSDAYESKHGDGVAQFNFYDGADLIESDGFYKNADGALVIASTPDKHNVVEDYVTNYAWFLDNTFGGLSAFSFAYDADEDDGIYDYFTIAADMADDADTLESIEAVLEQDVKFIIGMYGLGSDESFNSFAIYTDNAGIAGYKGSFTATYTDSYGSATDYDVDFDVAISGVGSTGLTLDGITADPYTVPAAEQAQYTALSTAITSMKSATTYKFATSVSDSGDVVSSGEAYVNDSGLYLKTTATDYYGEATTTYSGLKIREDGDFDFYSGSSADNLKASKTYAGPLSQYLADYDAAAEIFDYDAALSTADSYVFHLKDDFSGEALADVAYSFGSSGYEEIAVDFSIVVTSAGVLDKVYFTAEEDYYGYFTFTYDVVVDFDSFDGVVPTTIADFTGYTEYVPTGFALIDLTYPSGYTAEDALNDGFDGASSIPYFFNDTLINALSGVEYSPEDDEYYASLLFLFDPTAVTVEDVKAVLVAAGATFTWDDTYEAYEGQFNGNEECYIYIFDYSDSTTGESYVIIELMYVY